MCGFISTTILDFFAFSADLSMNLSTQLLLFLAKSAARNGTIHEKTLAQERNWATNSHFPSADEVTSGDISNLGLLRKMKDMRTPRRARTIASAAKFIAVSQSWGFFTTKKVPPNSCSLQGVLTRYQTSTYEMRFPSLPFQVASRVMSSR